MGVAQWFPIPLVHPIPGTTFSKGSTSMSPEEGTVNRSVSTWVRGAALPLALLFGLTIAAPSVGAAESVAAAPEPEPPLQAPVATAAAAKVAALDSAELAAATQAPAEEAESPSSFFKSPKGVAALVLAIAGVSYVIYSSQHDRINSPIR